MVYDWGAPASAEGLYIDINGERMPAEEATVSVFDRVVLYGDAVFDSFPVYDRRVILFDRHIDRLYRSIKAVKMDLDVPKAEMKRRVVDALEAGGVANGSVRIVVTRGMGPTGLVNTDELGEPTVIVITTRRPEEEFTHGEVATAKARIASTRTTPPDSLDPKIKTNNYLSNALAERERLGTDAKFTIMLDHGGTVAEAYAANVFVKDEYGAFKTPTKTQILGGLTREVVIEAARDLGYEMREEELTPYDLFTAEDLFLTSSGIGITFIEELDGRPIGQGEPSDELLALGEAFFEYIYTEENVELSL